MIRFVLPLLRGNTPCSSLPDRLIFNVLNDFVLGRHHNLIAVLASRTVRYWMASIQIFIRFLNDIDECDLFRFNERRFTVMHRFMLNMVVNV